MKQNIIQILDTKNDRELIMAYDDRGFYECSTMNKGDFSIARKYPKREE